MPSREIGGVVVELTNPDKVLYPATGTTKSEVIDYFEAIAPALLPHIAGRPVTRKRWPNGVERPAFFEKNLPEHAPRWIPRRAIEHSSRLVKYPLIESDAALVWLGQQAALELHVPQWRFAGTSPGPATRLVFDLDPGPGITLEQCAIVALAIRDMTTDISMPSFPVTSGSKGIHVYVGLPQSISSTSASTVARQVADNLQILFPELVTVTMAKVAREGRIFLDWSQNNAAKTTIAPYSLRGRAEPTVAAPRSWDEVERATTLKQLRFEEVLDRYRQSGDLLDGLDHAAVQEKRDDAVVSSRPPAIVEVVGSKVEPMLASTGSVTALDSREWVFEPKWDGFRLLAEFDHGRMRLLSRSGIVVTHRYPQLQPIAEELTDHQVHLDGEVVVFDDSGVARFEALQASGADARFIAFDVIVLDGVSVRDQSFAQRRALLEMIGDLAPSLYLSEILDGTGEDAMALSVEKGWEGIIAKRRDSHYLPGKRPGTWIKQKNWRTQEVIIGGWRLGQGGRANAIGALLLGLPGPDGLRYIGRVGTGFSDRVLVDLRSRLDRLARDQSPFAAGEAVDSTDAHWVEPTLVGEVRFAEWTDNGNLRHPSWRGLRHDKRPQDITVET